MKENTMTQAEATAATSASSANLATQLAPPFYRPWIWYRTYPKQGFWSSTRHFDHRGELVLQLGRRDGSGATEARNGYMRYMGTTQRKFYTARFDPISLTRIPNNTNIVGLKAYMQINNYPAVERDLNPGQPTVLAIGAWGSHVLRVGCVVKLESQGTYGEVICKISDVDQFNFYSASTETSLVEQGEPKLAQLRAELESEGSSVELMELGGLEDVAAAGLPAQN